MLFRELINAINSLRDATLVLAQAVRESWGGMEVPEYDEGELFAKIKARINADTAYVREISDPGRPSNRDLLGPEPGGKVFYASEDAGERQSAAEEIEAYLRDRGYGVDAVKEAREIVENS